MIESTSAILKDQSGQIHEQAASATISVERLQAAFANIYATMDMIDSYKLQALDSMQKTIDALSGEVQKSQAYLERAKNAPASAAIAAGGVRGDLQLSGPGLAQLRSRLPVNYLFSRKNLVGLGLALIGLVLVLAHVIVRVLALDRGRSVPGRCHPDAAETGGR